MQLKTKQSGASTMKKLIVALTLIVGVVSLSKAADTTYQGSIVNAVLTSSQNINIDLTGTDFAALQVNFATASPATVTFDDGRAGTGTITVLEGLNGLTTAYATNAIYI